VAQCKRKHLGHHASEEAAARAYNKYLEDGRGLHSSTFQLNMSALYRIGGARRGCVARVKGMFWGVWGVQGVFL